MPLTAGQTSQINPLIQHIYSLHPDSIRLVK